MDQLSLIDAGIFTEEELFDLEKWKRHGSRIYRESEEAKVSHSTEEKSNDRTLWEIGDWLLYGERLGKLKERALKREALAQFKGYAWPTIKGYKVVSKAIPESRRRYHLSYSMHREIASLEEPMQEQIFDWVGTRQKEIDQTNINLQKRLMRPKLKGPVSVRDVRQAITKQIGTLGAKAAKKGNKGAGHQGEVIKIPVPIEEFWRLKLIADVFDIGRNGHDYSPSECSAKLLILICRSYFLKHGEEIKVLGKADKGVFHHYAKKDGKDVRVPPLPRLPEIDEALIEEISRESTREYPMRITPWKSKAETAAPEPAVVAETVEAK
jgi:hypothetical protein